MSGNSDIAVIHQNLKDLQEVSQKLHDEIKTRNTILKGGLEESKANLARLNSIKSKK